MHRLAPATEHLRLFVTPEHDCNYLAGEKAITLFADPEYPKSPYLQGVLAKRGYRRSGPHLYRPRCSRCSACIPIRLPVARFSPNRSQQRCRQLNQDLVVRICSADYNEERYQLYCRYLATRHPGGGMDKSTPEIFSDFLFCDWARTSLIEFREREQLLAVAVCDHLPEALSAVYTFYNPDAGRRSPGVYAILWLIEYARSKHLKWLYLGYLIRNCRKMAYKANYLPHEQLLGDDWREISGASRREAD